MGNSKPNHTGNRRHGARTSEQREAYDRRFKGLPVIDAPVSIRVVVLPEDADSATPGDPSNCALARACKRQFGVTEALFFRSVAYVAIPDEDGTLRVERFLISAAAHDLLREFDLTGVPKSGGGFTMKAPTGSRTLEGQRGRDKPYRQALLRGDRVVNAKASEAVKRGLAKRAVFEGQYQLRDGNGMVHFETTRKN